MCATFKVIHVYLIGIKYFQILFFFMYNSTRTGNNSVKKTSTRTDFLFINYKGRQCLHKIGAAVHHFDSKY